MRPWILAFGATAGLALAVPQQALAQGFGVYEHGTCVMGRGGTAVASPCNDGSAIFFNPAGLAGQSGFIVTAGVTGIKATGDFTDDRTGQVNELQNDIIPVPHGYITYGKGDLAFGIGLFVPYGLGTEWENTFEGRFNGYDNDLRSIYIQPTVAYQFSPPLQDYPKVKVGAGFDLVLSSIELNQRLDLSEQVIDPTTGLTFANLGIPFHSDFADAELKSENQTGFGFNVGVIIEPTPIFSIGARYLSRVTIDYEGDATFEPVATGLTLPVDLPLGGTTIPAGTPIDALVASQFQAGGALVTQTVTTEITMPDQIVAGIAVKPFPSLMLLADYQWVHWELFDTLPVNLEASSREIVESYQNTNGFRVGFDWGVVPMVNFRGGYLYHEGAAPPQTVTPLLPEGDRSEVTVGFGFSFTPMVSADVAYQFIRQEDRRGRVREAPAGESPTVDLNSGFYTFRGHLGGLTLTLRF